MGVSDRKWFRFFCERCDVIEVTSVTDSGTWGPMHWSDLGTVRNFSIVSAGGGTQEPEIRSANCARCGTAAEVRSQYGLSDPSW